MKKKFIKPNWYPSLDVIANKQGWVYTKNHNEVLSAIARLDTRIAAEEQPSYIGSKMIGRSTGSVIIINAPENAIVTVDGIVLSNLNQPGNLGRFGTLIDATKESTYTVEMPNGAPITRLYFESGVKTVDQWYEGGYDIQLRLGKDIEVVPPVAPPLLTNYEKIFWQSSKFNHPNIVQWDTSIVTVMFHAFYQATIFNQPIGTWNTSNVTDMSAMFGNCLSFNQNISMWNTSNVTNMYGMFNAAITFNQNISSWNVSKVTDMSYMFNSAQLFDQNLTSWCVSLITSLPSDFADYSALNPDNYPIWGTCPI